MHTPASKRAIAEAQRRAWDDARRQEQSEKMREQMKEAHAVLTARKELLEKVKEERSNGSQA